MSEDATRRMSNYRVRCATSSFLSGKPASFEIVLYQPRPHFSPWRVVESGFPTYAAAAERARELREQRPS